MKTRDYHAMRGRVPGAWDDTGLALAVANEIDRAVRKAKRELNDSVVRCPTCGDSFGVKLGIRQEKRGAGR